MIITKETELFTKPIMFGDGADGLFMQQHKLLIEDQDSGVMVVITGHKGRDNTKQEFAFDGTDYDNAMDALKAAGHEFEVDE